MLILYFLLALFMIVASFVAGLKLSDHYHWQAQQQQDYALRKQYARLKAGCDADASCQPYVAPPLTRRRNPIPASFVDHLRRNGAATIRVENSETDAKNRGQAPGYNL